MNQERHSWHSSRLGKEMGIRVYGHYGPPLLVFPTSGGDENEYEGHSVIGALQRERRAHTEAGEHLEENRHQPDCAAATRS